MPAWCEYVGSAHQNIIFLIKLAIGASQRVLVEPTRNNFFYLNEMEHPYKLHNRIFYQEKADEDL